MAASSKETSGTSGTFVTVDETAVADLNAFLRDTRTLLRDSRDSMTKQKKRLTLVLGNEAADLDSVACAVSLAYSLHLANDDETRAYAPVVCVPREDFPLRADARWLLDHVGIDVDALTFDGEISFSAFARTTTNDDDDDDALRLVLVDHNAVASSSAYAAFADAVDAVVDHHDDEKKYPAACDAVIVPTGSCATLVAEALVEPSGTATRVSFETAARLFPKKKTGEDSDARRLRVGDPRAALLLAAVLLDTQNLNASATRVHARDVAIVPILASLAGTGDVGAFHDELKRRRFDQSGLSPRDLLRRDYKQWRFVPRATEDVADAPATSATSPAWDVGVASFGVPLGEMATDARAIRDACAAFGRDKRVDALALMCAFDDETTNDATSSRFRRQFAIAFFDADAEGKGASLSAPPRDDALVALSARMFEPGGVLPVALGGLEPVADATALDAFGGFAFEQGDPTRSRKKAQPALAAFFEGAPPPRAAAARAVDGPVDDGD